MKLLVKSGERVELVSPSDWLTAKNRRLQDLEFFNTIGRVLPLVPAWNERLLLNVKQSVSKVGVWGVCTGSDRSNVDLAPLANMAKIEDRYALRSDTSIPGITYSGNRLERPFII